jgi:hypothetical protein
MNFIAKPAVFVRAAILLATVATLSAGAFAQTLHAGDLPATVTIGQRPLTASTDHVAAFTRGSILYVSGEDLMRAMSGRMEHQAGHYTVTAFPGMLQQRTAEFTIGSADATFEGKPVTMKGPAIRAYGQPYIPVSFFGQPPLRTKVIISSDNRKAQIVLPPDMR